MISIKFCKKTNKKTISSKQGWGGGAGCCGGGGGGGVVIAALTIPTLISKYKKAELQARFKQASAIIYKFQENTFKDGDNPANVIMQDRSNGLQTIQTYFNVKNINTRGNAVSQLGNIYKTLTKRSANIYQMDDGNFELDNGMTVYKNNAGGPVGLAIDTNGYKNGPNQFGYDLFFWSTETLYGDNLYGTFKPAGGPGFYLEGKNTFCSDTSTNSQNGLGCTYWATIDPDYFNNLKL